MVVPQVINALADTLEALQQLATAVLLGQPGGTLQSAAEAGPGAAVGSAARSASKAGQPETAGSTVRTELCHDTTTSSTLSHSQGVCCSQTILNCGGVMPCDCLAEEAGL
jgi:hypothetical protein